MRYLDFWSKGKGFGLVFVSGLNLNIFLDPLVTRTVPTFGANLFLLQKKNSPAGRKTRLTQCFALGEKTFTFLLFYSGPAIRAFRECQWAWAGVKGQRLTV